MTKCIQGSPRRYSAASPALQARQATEKLLPHLNEEEQAWFRRGKNAHSHAPKSATAKQYSMATGLEALFGGLYLAGRTGRLNELFRLMME